MMRKGERAYKMDVGSKEVLMESPPVSVVLFVCVYICMYVSALNLPTTSSKGFFLL